MSFTLEYAGMQAPLRKNPAGIGENQPRREADFFIGRENRGSLAFMVIVIPFIFASQLNFLVGGTYAVRGLWLFGA